jgi:general stress protein 26
MNSINRNQAENTREDLYGRQAVEQIREVVDKAETCFLCTAVKTGDSKGVRPMNVREVDDEGNLWFLSAEDSHTNKEISLNPCVKLFFQGSAHADFLYLCGHATISREKERIRELWEPVIKTWFTGGVDDPRITVIKVTPTEGYYWDTKHGNLVAGMKMMVGSMVGKTVDDSIEGRIAVH